MPRMHDCTPWDIMRYFTEAGQILWRYIVFSSRLAEMYCSWDFSLAGTECFTARLINTCENHLNVFYRNGLFSMQVIYTWDEPLKRLIWPFISCILHERIVFHPGYMAIYFMYFTGTDFFPSKSYTPEMNL